jgi:hypothetical protein
MALDAKKRHKKLVRKQARQRAKKKGMVRRSRHDADVIWQRASLAPVLHCCTFSTLWDEPMAQVLISRELPSRQVAFVIFLLDTACLGVKDLTYHVAPRSEYEEKVYGKLNDEDLVDISPAFCRKLVEGAVEYARDLGFPPHRDYRVARLIFGDIDAAQAEETFQYGRHGKPYFASGPYDSPQRCRQIIEMLNDRCGPDGFHYLVAASDPRQLGLSEAQVAELIQDQIEDVDWDGE